ncbi:hypothetical protein [Thermocoleostomius sinensis]|uniref:Uncharacterized protein n=1 Tax=Thermocoleostomius sinensis A174 TaxID=2016057 RepID=A0A9E8ZD00_9CYAN|nr:hypothetical protein [Thermocoleostomius sinensis]WAL60868.1 hypothetical protein OXH18_02400 [Thermocoleostomius sinensis A174]
MPKRFTIGPLGEHDDHWLTVWAALIGKNKTNLATALIGLRVREKKEMLQDMLEYSAQLRGMTPESLFNALLSNPHYLEQHPAPTGDEREDATGSI